MFQPIERPIGMPGSVADGSTMYTQGNTPYQFPKGIAQQPQGVPQGMPQGMPDALGTAKQPQQYSVGDPMIDKYINMFLGA